VDGDGASEHRAIAVVPPPPEIPPEHGDTRRVRDGLLLPERPPLGGPHAEHVEQIPGAVGRVDLLGLAVARQARLAAREPGHAAEALRAVLPLEEVRVADDVTLALEDR